MANPLIAVHTAEAVMPAAVQPCRMRSRRFEPLPPGPVGRDALPVIGPDPRITATGAHDTVVGALAVTTAGPAPAREER